MRASSNGRARRSATEWREVLSRFQASDQGPRAFCQTEKIGLASFMRWRRKLSAGDAEAGSVGSRFVELTPPREISTCWAVEVELPNGCIVRLRG